MPISTTPPDPFATFVTRDPLLLRSLVRLRSWAQKPLGVLLTGESGVGKSLLARLLHLASPSTRGSFFLLYTANEGCPPASMWATLREGGGTLVIDGLERWSLESQATLAHHLAAHPRTSVRVVATSRMSEARLRLEAARRTLVSAVVFIGRVVAVLLFTALMVYLVLYMARQRFSYLQIVLILFSVAALIAGFLALRSTYRRHLAALTLREEEDDTRRRIGRRRHEGPF